MVPVVRLGELAESISQGLVTSGHGAGARSGDWLVQEVSLKNIVNDRIELSSLDSIELEFNRRTERHLLRPYDVLVTARSTIAKAALVPPALSRAVANATLAIVRPKDPEMGLFLWWFFTSRYGRAQLESRMVGTTVQLLRVSALAEIEVPLPPMQDLRLIAQLIESSEWAYAAAVQAAEIRHSLVRDHLIEDLLHGGRERNSHATH